MQQADHALLASESIDDRLTNGSFKELCHLRLCNSIFFDQCDKQTYLKPQELAERFAGHDLIVVSGEKNAWTEHGDVSNSQRPGRLWVCTRYYNGEWMRTLPIRANYLASKSPFGTTTNIYRVFKRWPYGS
uniref:Uncharacterized protein n=1 Tax=Schistocephalus solidus TaxID=70667 RepID=A0A0V0J5P8_SCHSO